MHAGHHDVEAIQQFRGLVQRPVLQDVDLDAGEQPDLRVACAVACRSGPGADPGDHIQLFGEALGAQAVRDPERGRVVGQGQVLTAQRPGRVQHGLDRRTAVGPVAVRVQVAAEACQQLPPAGGERFGASFAQGRKVVGNAAVDRLGDHLEGPVADPLHPLQPAVRRPCRQFRGGEAANQSGRLAEGLHLVGGGAFAFQPESDLIEGSKGVHPSIIRTALRALSRAYSRLVERILEIPGVGPIVL